MLYYQHLADLALEKILHAKQKINFAYELHYKDSLISLEQYEIITKKYNEIKDHYNLVYLACNKARESALQNGTGRYDSNAITKEEELLIAEAMNLITAHE